MNRFITILLSVLTILFSFGCDKRELVFESDEINLESYSNEYKLKGCFNFNVKGGSVEIFSTSSTCGCTIAPLAKKVYQNGEKGIVPFEIDTTGRRGKSTVYIDLKTNLTKDSDKKLKLNMNIKPIMSFDRKIVLINRNSSENEELRVNLFLEEAYVPDRHKLLISHNENISYEIIEKSRHEYQLVFKRISVLQNGQYSVKVRLLGADPNEKETEEYIYLVINRE